MASLYHQYYDRIYAAKDYRGEVATLLKTIGRSPRRALDVGCGTGTHALILAQSGCAVTGLDLDAGAIAVARGKAVNARAVFHCLDVAKLDDRGFDLAVSLFNVINYLGSAPDLQAFFTAIHDRLEPGAPYIFDCWNGLAALLDPPKHKRAAIQSGDETITVETTPTTDRMAQVVHMVNRVTITGGRQPPRSFNYDYDSYLWTPWHLRSLLSAAGFIVERIATWNDATRDARDTDWKILFICRKGSR